MITDRKTLILEWGKAAEADTLLTPKHDPNNLSITESSYRSVIAYELSASLEQFIKSGDYTINCYQDQKYPNGSGYYEVTPSPGSTFTVAGSGVPAGSLTPTSALDRLILVCGPVQPWHIYAETSSSISGAVTSGRLILSASC